MPDWFSYVVNGGRTIAYGDAGNNASEAVGTGSTMYSGIASGALDISNSATVTQSTNKTTGVTANAHSGQITTSNAELDNNARVAFTVANSNVESTDVIAVNYEVSGYFIQAYNIRNGAFDIIIRNSSGSALSNALVLRFVVLSKN